MTPRVAAPLLSERSRGELHERAYRNYLRLPSRLEGSEVAVRWSREA